MVALLSACSWFRTGTDDTSMWNAKKNTDCAEFKSVKVFQTLKDSALAKVCDKGETKYCSGMVVVVPKKWDLQLWDDKIITAPQDKCFVYKTTVEYETTGHEKKTVPVLGFDYKYSPKSEDEAIERLQQDATDFYKNCYLNFEKEENKTLKKEGNELCECFESFKFVSVDDLQETTQTDKQEEKFSFEANRYLFMQLKYLANLDNCMKKYPKAADAY